MRDNYHNYQSLLAKAAQLYERHGNCRGKYMNDLKELFLKDNNLVLIHDLRDAMREVETELRKKMWDEIESELKSEIQYFPDKKRSYKKGNKGLCYQLSESTSLEVVGDSAIWFGIRCSKKKYKDKYDTLKNALEDVSGEKPDDDYPFWQKVDRLEDPLAAIERCRAAEICKKNRTGNHRKRVERSLGSS